MINFNNFLTEAASDESRLTHLEHAEDHVINDGDKGYAHAFHNLQDTHDKLHGKHNKTTVMTKYDGSPSIVFGHHPETKKFFVATKSAFNKNPKLNHTEADIEKNHGHAPGLVTKLKHALKHLPKVTPKEGIYQGDLMHSGTKASHKEGDVDDHGGKYHFKPNTITYSTKKNSEEGKKIAKSKIGVVVHTAYKGKTFEHMKPDYAPDLTHFKHHEDVHMIDNRNDVQHAKMTPEQHKNFQHHMHAATKHFNDTPAEAHKAVAPHGSHLKVYINKTVREGTKPTSAGYHSHLKDRHMKEIGKVKTQKAIDTKSTAMKKDLEHVTKNKAHFDSVLKMHHHLQKAKDELVHAMSSHQKFEHHIGGLKAKPEGYVTVRNNRPTKLVDRAEFSRANFLKDNK